MKITRLARSASALALACAVQLAAAQSAPASAEGPVVIGFITDLSGPYADLDGTGGSDAIKMAIADYGGKMFGKPIDYMVVDHQNKPDLAAAKAREWIDTRGLTLLVGGANSAAALSMNDVSREKKRVLIVVSAGSDRLTDEACQPYSIHYAYDTVALARGTAAALVKQGYKNWYFLTADFAFGTSLAKAAANVVTAQGGTVLGQARHPANASDFATFMLQAQAAKPQVLGLANAGNDTINSIKAAKEFGLTSQMKVAGLLMFLSDVNSLGLPTAQNMVLTDSWYWDQSDGARAFAKRYFERNKRMPTSAQAANYSATMHYLRAVEKAGTVNADKVMALMKSTPIDDFYTKGTIRKDGRGVHDMYLYQVKTPAESKRSWDYLKVVATIPADQAFRSVSESKCPMLKTP